MTEVVVGELIKQRTCRLAQQSSRSWESRREQKASLVHLSLDSKRPVTLHLSGRGRTSLLTVLKEKNYLSSYPFQESLSKWVSSRGRGAKRLSHHTMDSQRPLVPPHHQCTLRFIADRERARQTRRYASQASRGYHTNESFPVLSAPATPDLSTHGMGWPKYSLVGFRWPLACRR